jgi:hypothetical protein
MALVVAPLCCASSLPAVAGGYDFEFDRGSVVTQTLKLKISVT